MFCISKDDFFCFLGKNFALTCLVSAFKSSDCLGDSASSCRYSIQYLEIRSAVLVFSKLGPDFVGFQKDVG